MSNNVLFLDIDGVLNALVGKKVKNMETFYDPKKLKMVQEIVKKTNCKIVLTSMRLYFQNCKEELNAAGLKIDDCLEVPFINKENGIRKWLRNHCDVEEFVILDDSEINAAKEHFVQTNYRYGLTKENAKEVILLLNGKSELIRLIKEAKVKLRLIVKEKELFKKHEKLIYMVDYLIDKYQKICVFEKRRIINIKETDVIRKLIWNLRKAMYACEIELGYDKEEINKEISVVEIMDFLAKNKGLSEETKERKINKL